MRPGPEMFDAYYAFVADWTLPEPFAIFNHLIDPYSVRLCLGKEVSHVENALMATAPGANVGEPNYQRARMEDEIWQSATRLRAIIAPRTDFVAAEVTPPDSTAVMSAGRMHFRVNCAGRNRAWDFALLPAPVPTYIFCAIQKDKILVSVSDAHDLRHPEPTSAQNDHTATHSTLYLVPLAFITLEAVTAYFSPPPRRRRRRRPPPPPPPPQFFVEICVEQNSN
ncbi:unnamed protein product [Schistocephalus solidus]|uniref:DUF4238 domain-containing protein n=1 Tax=Schistocephalus solidus TaxID=70667 RepID=A0A183T997_SCHSO|nr:unnamed protein product [Schistocephalus solidus]